MQGRVWVLAAVLAGGTMLGVSAARAAAPEGPLDVETAVRIALEQNTVYLRSQAAVDAAAGSRLSALAGILPSAGGDVSWSRSDQTSLSTLTEINGEPVPQIDLPRNALNTSRSWGVDVTESVSLSSWYDYRSAQSLLQAARFGQAATRQDLAFQVRQQFYLALRAQDLLQVQEEDKNLAEDELRRVQTMFDLGSVARVDVLRTQVRLADADVALIRQRNQVDIETSRLATLIGFVAGTPLQLAGDLTGTPAVVDSAAATEDSMSRPDVLQSEAALESASKNHRSAALSRLPTLFASVGVSGSSGDSEIDQLDFNDETGQLESINFQSDNTSDGLTVRVGASVSLDAFLNSGRAKSAGAARRQAEYDLENLRLGVQQELQEAILNHRTAAQAIVAAERGVEAAEEDLRLSRERYQQGLGTILELTEAQVNLTRARYTLVDAKTSLKISEAALAKARGHDFP